MYREIIQIVTGLPPMVDGVGDYGFSLAKKLRSQYGIRSRFIVVHPHWNGGAQLDGFPVYQLSLRTSHALAQLLMQGECQRQTKALTVLLQYSGYGYAKRGWPLWLLQGLKQWKQSGLSHQLITYFHELYAFGPVWNSSFWFSRLQRDTVRELSKMSAAIFTNREAAAAILASWNKTEAKPVIAVPVFSNVGEPDRALSLNHQKKRHLVIFGKYRHRIYQKHSLALKRICSKLKIEKIYDIGPSTGLDLRHLMNGIAISETGPISPAEVSGILLDALVGFVDYASKYLGRSGVFAAYCAHGVIPIIAGYQGNADNLVKGKHYLVAEQFDDRFDFDQHQSIRDCVYAWYAGHSVAEHAKKISNVLDPKFGDVNI